MTALALFGDEEHGRMPDSEISRRIMNVGLALDRTLDPTIAKEVLKEGALAIMQLWEDASAAEPRVARLKDLRSAIRRRKELALTERMERMVEGAH